MSRDQSAAMDVEQDREPYELSDEDIVRHTSSGDVLSWGQVTDKGAYHDYIPVVFANHRLDKEE